MECYCFSYRQSDICRQIELAWEFHRAGDFGQSDQIFHNIAAFNGSSRTCVDFGRSLRYRGDFQQAFSVLESAWEDAKHRNCVKCQLSALTELLLCHRQTNDFLRFSQISQLFYGLYFKEPDVERETRLLSLILAWDAWNSGDLDTAGAHSQLTASHENQGLCVNFEALLAEIEWSNGQAKESQNRLFRCCELARAAGDFYEALTLAERYSQRALETRQWMKAATALRLVSQFSEILSFPVKHRQSLHWRNRIEGALIAGQLDPLRN